MNGCEWGTLSFCFSLVAEIGWLASLDLEVQHGIENLVSVSLPRLGGWRVRRISMSAIKPEVSVSLPRLGGWRADYRGRLPCLREFQSRCRDWVVGEFLMIEIFDGVIFVSVSLPRLGGWRAGLLLPSEHYFVVSVSLPRLGGWRAAHQDRREAQQKVSVSLPRLGGWRGLPQLRR